MTGRSSRERNSPPDGCCQGFATVGRSPLELVSSPVIDQKQRESSHRLLSLCLATNAFFDTGYIGLQKLHFEFWVAFQCNLFDRCNFWVIAATERLNSPCRRFLLESICNGTILVHKISFSLVNTLDLCYSKSKEVILC